MRPIAISVVGRRCNAAALRWRPTPKLVAEGLFPGYFLNLPLCSGGRRHLRSVTMLRVEGRSSAPVSPFSLQAPADVCQPAPSVGSNSLSSADTPLSRWFSDQLAEVAASAHLDEQASQSPPRSCHQQYLRQLPRSLSSKQFSVRYKHWADKVIEDMMEGSAVARSCSCSMRCAARRTCASCVPRYCSP